MLNIIKNKVLSGKYEITTNPTWLPNPKHIIRVCDAVDRTSGAKVTVIVFDINSKYPYDVLFHLVRQNRAISFLQAGIFLEDDKFRFIIVKDVDDSVLVQVENALFDHSTAVQSPIIEEEEKSDPPVLPIASNNLTVKQLIIVGSIVFALIICISLLIVVGPDIVAVLSPTATPTFIPPPLSTITPTATVPPFTPTP